jgi:hypothetical protein
MISAITSSDDLAFVLNAPAATLEDAAETPRDWLAGIWVAGEVYPLDEQATTDTLAVLADGTAAVRFSPKGEYCNVSHGPGSYLLCGQAHWCPADVDSWTEEEDARGVTRDWRSVHVWDANGFSETTVHDTLGEARTAFDREAAELKVIAETLAG